MAAHDHEHAVNALIKHSFWIFWRLTCYARCGHLERPARFSNILLSTQGARVLVHYILCLTSGFRCHHFTYITFVSLIYVCFLLPLRSKSLNHAWAGDRDQFVLFIIFFILLLMASEQNGRHSITLLFQLCCLSQYINFSKIYFHW